MGDVIRIAAEPTPCPPWCERDHPPGDFHGLIIADGDEASVMLMDHNDGLTRVFFRYPDDLAPVQERAILTVEQAEERGRALLAAVDRARDRTAALHS